MIRQARHSFSCRLYHTRSGVYGDWPRSNDSVLSVHAPRETQNRVAQPALNQLVDAYRRYGHRQCRLDPLGINRQWTPYCYSFLSNFSDLVASGRLLTELQPDLYGLNDADQNFTTTNVLFGNIPAHTTLKTIVDRLNAVYCGFLGAEFQHLETAHEREWFAEQYELLYDQELSTDEKAAVAKLMLECQNFDHFVASKFKTVKRYGGEGAESMMCFFYQLVKQSAQGGISDVIIGMPHRGRLNLMATLLKYPAVHMFQKMRGKPEFPAGVKGLGDVLSHLSTSVDLTFDNGRSLHVNLLPNPSHLEAVGPVAVGKARARQQSLAVADYCREPSALPGDRVLPVIVHGDAAISGQGINFEMLNMSQLPHFRVGGSVHLVVNNQVGYTTEQERGRSSEYSTDLAKVVSCPVLHVNGEHPECVVKATDLALRYRQLFRKDIFVDLVCFRRWGHNELDDPSFTQPRMYDVIGARKSVPDLYAQHLVEKGSLTQDDVQQCLGNHTKQLQQQYEQLDSFVPQANHLERHWSGLTQAPDNVDCWDTGVDVNLLKFLGKKSVDVPQTMNVHPHLRKTHVDGRLRRLEDGSGLDWSTAEALAFGSLLSQGFAVRICGQDVGRGTFSQRHAMLVDRSTDEAYIPLNSISEKQTAFLEVTNSFLSEEAALAFEYGMSIESPKRLVLWEAQFGDFFNGAQIIIDTFVSSGETKWLTQSGLVMMLPHGFDGAGPEHSSCRIERFLQMCDSKESACDGADVNFEIAHPTTSAQYFHLLRRQMLRNYRKPLVLASPKILLRLPAASSSLDAMQPGTFYHPVIGDDTVDTTKVTKVVLVCGKHYYALNRIREEKKLTDVALIRLESLCPFPADQLRTQLAKYTNAKKYIWSQEEPRNMGAWSFVKPRVQNLLAIDLKYVGRPELPIPGVAIGEWHQRQHEDVLAQTFA